MSKEHTEITISAPDCCFREKYFKLLKEHEHLYNCYMYEIEYKPDLGEAMDFACEAFIAGMKLLVIAFVVVFTSKYMILALLW